MCCMRQRGEKDKHKLTLPVNSFSYLCVRAGLPVFPGQGQQTLRAAELAVCEERILLHFSRRKRIKKE